MALSDSHLLRSRVDSLGSAIAEHLSLLIDSLPATPSGPQRLADELGLTVATASRVLSAISQSHPIAVFKLLPGPTPLRKLVESAVERGASRAASERSLATLDDYESLIRDDAGDVSAFKAMISTWLPDGQREFAHTRRRTVFRALRELRGFSSNVEIASHVLWPSAEPGLLNGVTIAAMLGLDRARPDAHVRLMTRHSRPPGGSGSESPPISGERWPEPAEPRWRENFTQTIRLDEFCTAPPAPLHFERFGDDMQYSLGSTGFGPKASVDLVLAELRANYRTHQVVEPGSKRPNFFMIPSSPMRMMVFDLILHRDVYPAHPAELLGYDTTMRGSADVNDASRTADVIPIDEELLEVGPGVERLRLPEFPKYSELLRSVTNTLGLAPEEFRAFRVKHAFPLPGTQLTLALGAPGT